MWSAASAPKYKVVLKFVYTIPMLGVFMEITSFLLDFELQLNITKT